MIYKVIALVNDEQMVMSVFPFEYLAHDYCLYLEDKKIDSKIVTDPDETILEDYLWRV